MGHFAVGPGSVYLCHAATRCPWLPVGRPSTLSLTAVTVHSPRRVHSPKSSLRQGQRASPRSDALSGRYQKPGAPGSKGLAEFQHRLRKRREQELVPSWHL